jgi:hypothetical protein
VFCAGRQRAARAGGNAVGKLWDVDAETGRSARQVVLPMQVSAPPGTSQVRRLYQVGDHSNLYVLDDQQFECREVYYLAHRPGTVSVPPVMALGHLFVAVNTGRDFCHVHVLRTDENGQSLAPARDPIRLAGRVTTPLLQAGARVLAMTDLGAIRMPGGESGQREGTGDQRGGPVGQTFKTPLDSFPVLDGGRMWVGSDRLTRYEIQTSRNQLSSQGIHFQRDTFVAAPLVIGRRGLSRPPAAEFAGVYGGGQRGGQRQLLWETDLAVPAALLNVDLEKRQIDAVSMQAELFQVTPGGLQGRQAGPGRRRPWERRTVAFDQAIAWTTTAGRWSAAKNAAVLCCTSPMRASSAGRLEMRPIKPAADVGRDHGAGPVPRRSAGALGQRPGRAGGPADGRPADAAFSSARRRQARRRLAAACCDGRPFRSGRQPEAKSIGWESRTPAASSGSGRPSRCRQPDRFCIGRGGRYGVRRGPRATSDTVISMAAGDLAAGSNWPLEGRVVWGPESIGDWVLMATDRGQLLCFESGGKQRWTAELKYGGLTGRTVGP